jgi:DNA-binding CsgD family transcriptional regulator
LAHWHSAHDFVETRHRDHGLAVVRSPDPETPESDVAVVVLDNSGSIVHASPIARRFFAEYCAGEAVTDDAMPGSLSRWLRETDVDSPGTLVLSAPWGRLRVRALPGRTPQGWRLLLLDDRRTAALPSVKALRALGLTDRQAQVLRLLASGHGTQKIADHLYLSPATVRKHLENIYDRLGVKSRTEAVAIALQL